MCQCTGGPHCFPFIGGKFDIHQAGVFQIMKLGDFNFQAKLVTCRAKQPWSGGLTVKCIFGLALQTSAGNIMTTDARMRHIKLKGKRVRKRLTMMPGPTVLKQVAGRIRMRGMSGVTLPGDHEYTVVSRKFYIKLMTMRQYSTFFIALTSKGRSMFGKVRITRISSMHGVCLPAYSSCASAVGTRNLWRRWAEAVRQAAKHRKGR